MNPTLIAIVLFCLSAFTGTLAVSLKSQGHGETCGENVICDVSAGLFCGLERKVCSCKESQVFDSTVGQCLSFANSICDTEEGIQQVCVKNSHCVPRSNALHETSGVCQCLSGFEERDGICDHFTNLVESEDVDGQDADIDQEVTGEPPGSTEGPGSTEEPGSTETNPTTPSSSPVLASSILLLISIKLSSYLL